MDGFQDLPAHARRERAALEQAGCHDWAGLARLEDRQLAGLALAGSASLPSLVRLRGQARLVVDLDLQPGQAALLLHAGIPDRGSLAAADPQQLWRQTGRLQRRLTGGAVPPPDLAQVRRWIARARRATN
ncbi:MAG: DUF4332 domain-containing protein [Cyanobium sp. M30B3]|jgi:hypothetical protein|nr:MAG: DUF4332 domain-containing protein [Cyanobium sp. M30B3]